MQVGYHRKSDDSLSSGWWEGEALEQHVLELEENPDIDAAWLRATPRGTVLVHFKGPVDGPDFN